VERGRRESGGGGGAKRNNNFGVLKKERWTKRREREQEALSFKKIQSSVSFESIVATLVPIALLSFVVFLIRSPEESSIQ
jgi:hypothetical protein